MENKIYTKAEMLEELKGYLHESVDQLLEGYTWQEQAPCIKDLHEWYLVVKGSRSNKFRFEQSMMSPNEFVITQIMEE